MNNSWPVSMLTLFINEKDGEKDLTKGFNRGGINGRL